MEQIINHGLISIQAGLSVYVLFLLYTTKSKYTLFYTFVSMFFLILKFEVLDLVPLSIFDYLLWGIYNILLYLFLICYISDNTK